ncbi:Intraflagellar transport protein 46 [Intoshia linei]|uniref:Intraflagellar transport protein 46 homolog n=1 Tax=Intoshia linei TaxID=1819745 RepID=A0A177AYD3_9BILA|nr:Intraflagellar transport protein 46 [Intoshia linei]
MESRQSFRRDISTTSLKRHENDMYDESITLAGESTEDDGNNPNLPSDDANTQADNVHTSIMHRLQSSRGIRKPEDGKESANDYYKNSKTTMERDEKINYKTKQYDYSKNVETSSNEMQEFEESEESEVGDVSEDTSTVSTPLAGAYNPQDYEHLDVSNELKKLFSLIDKYTPTSIELNCVLKPFIPQFMASVGDTDPMLKIDRPDGKITNLGINNIDEPSFYQSDPTIVQLQLEQKFKYKVRDSGVVSHVSSASKPIKSLSYEDKHTKKAISNWISSITEIHQSQPPPTVHYTRIMPQIDDLMQQWPNDVNTLFDNLHVNDEDSQIQTERINKLITSPLIIPLSSINTKTHKYVDIMCPIVDIPVYPKSRIQSLHQLFTLYSVIRDKIEPSNDD